MLLTCGMDFEKAWGLGFPLVLKSFVRQWEMEGVQDKQKGTVTEQDKARQCFSSAIGGPTTRESESPGVFVTMPIPGSHTF